MLGQFYEGAQVETKRVGVEVAANLVLEFSNAITKCTELGLTWEAHEECRLGFQDRLLFTILHQTVALLGSVQQHQVRLLTGGACLPALLPDYNPRRTHFRGWCVGE